MAWWFHQNTPVQQLMTWCWMAPGHLLSHSCANRWLGAIQLQVISCHMEVMACSQLSPGDLPFQLFSLPLDLKNMHMGNVVTLWHGAVWLQGICHHNNIKDIDLLHCVTWCRISDASMVESPWNCSYHWISWEVTLFFMNWLVNSDQVMHVSENQSLVCELLTRPLLVQIYH